MSSLIAVCGRVGHQRARGVLFCSVQWTTLQDLLRMEWRPKWASVILLPVASIKKPVEWLLKILYKYGLLYRLRFFVLFRLYKLDVSKCSDLIKKERTAFAGLWVVPRKHFYYQSKMSRVRASHDFIPNPLNFLFRRYVRTLFIIFIIIFSVYFVFYKYWVKNWTYTSNKTMNVLNVIFFLFADADADFETWSIHAAQWDIRVLFGYNFSEW
jgi:hypothetical protein